MIEPLLGHLGIIAGVMVCVGIGPLVAVLFLLRRRSKARALRRSPIGITLLRQPGQTLRQQLDDEQTEVGWDVMALSLFPLIVLASYLGLAHLIGWDLVLNQVPIAVVGTVLFLGFFIRRLVTRGKRLDVLRAGYDAELAVGQELDLLTRRGVAVFHDVPAEGFNIDHVVVTEKTVFAVETKGYTKLNHIKGREGATVEFDGMTLRFPTWASAKPVEQAERQAKWLADWIKKSTGHACPVQPVLALPGWFVKERGVGPVKVLSGRMLSTLVREPDAQVSERMQSVLHQLDQRCRTVTPTMKQTGTE